VGFAGIPESLLHHGIIVNINNYNYAMVKQNFRMNSGSFASPKHYPSLEVQCWALCKSIWISYGPLYSMRISTWKPECKKDGDLDSDFEQ
jgi:hypothetical protein